MFKELTTGIASGTHLQTQLAPALLWIARGDAVKHVTQLMSD